MNFLKSNSDGVATVLATISIHMDLMVDTSTAVVLSLFSLICISQLKANSALGVIEHMMTINCGESKSYKEIAVFFSETCMPPSIFFVISQ